MADIHMLLNAAARAESSQNWLDALKLYANVRQQVPDHPEATMGTARLSLMMGRPERALEDFTIVLVRDNDNVEALCGRGECYRQLGRDDIALRDLKRALELEPRVDAYLSLSRIYADAQEGALAWDAIDAALDLEPGDPDLLLERARLAVTRLAAGEMTGAECTPIVEEALAEWPQDPMALMIRAEHAFVTDEGNQNWAAWARDALSQEPELAEEGWSCLAKLTD